MLVHPPSRRSRALLIPTSGLYFLLVGCGDEGGDAGSGPSEPSPCGGCGSGLVCDEAAGACVKSTTVMVEVPDGSRLATHVWLPEGESGPVATILLRTPYGFPTGPFAELVPEMAHFWTDRGYAFVSQDCRGRFQSEGTFEPFRHEVDDGRAATRWIVSQPWSSGRVGTFGGSYEGYTAVAAAIGNADVHVVVADDAAEDMRFLRAGGALRTSGLDWAYALDHGGWFDEETRRLVANSLVPEAVDEAVLGRDDPFWNALATAENVDAFHPHESLREKYAGTCVPLLSIYSPATQWEDSIRIWEGFVADGCPEHTGDHRLVLTPEGHTHHMTVLPRQETAVTRLMVDYFDEFLRDAPLDLSGVPRVQHASMGEDVYRPVSSWRGDGSLSLYLDSSTLALGAGALVAAPPAEQPPVSLAMDPEEMDPCDGDYPSVLYLSEPLAAPLRVVGQPSVELTVVATSEDLDIIVGLGAYDEVLGTYQPVQLGTLRARYRNSPSAPEPLASGAATDLTVMLHPVTHLFAAGTRIALSVTGGSCHFVKNPLTGEPLSAQSEWSSGTLELRGNESAPSRVVLPFVEE